MNSKAWFRNRHQIALFIFVTIHSLAINSLFNVVHAISPFTAVTQTSFTLGHNYHTSLWFPARESYVKPIMGAVIEVSFFASNSKVCLGEALAIWVVIVVKIRLVTGKLQLPSRCIRLCDFVCAFWGISVTIGGLCQSWYTCRYRSLFSCEYTNTHNGVNIFFFQKLSIPLVPVYLSSSFLEEI